MTDKPTDLRHYLLRKQTDATDKVRQMAFNSLLELWDQCANVEVYGDYVKSEDSIFRIITAELLQVAGVSLDTKDIIKAVVDEVSTLDIDAFEEILREEEADAARVAKVEAEVERFKESEGHLPANAQELQEWRDKQ